MKNRYADIKNKNQCLINEYRGSSDGTVNFYPNYIQLEHTNLCNARCIMCNHAYTSNRGASSISKEIIRKIENILPYCSVLMLNGDGEPFLTPDILDLLHLYIDYEIRIGTNTNLCVLTDEMIAELLPYFSFLNISCDGAYKSTFEMIRFGLNYEKFIENLEKINKFAPEVRKNMDVVLMRQNLEEAVALVQFASRYNFKEIRFHRMGINPCLGNEVDADSQFPLYASYWMEKAREAAAKSGINIKTPEWKEQYDASVFETEKRYVKGFSKSEMQKRIKAAEQFYKDSSLKNGYLSQNVELDDFSSAAYLAGKSCRWALERCYIDLNGNVSPCCYNVMKKMGNLMEVNSFEELWNGEMYRKFRICMNEGKLPKWCKTCQWIREGIF